MLISSRECPLCKSVETFEVFPDDYERYEKGTFVQDAFPYLSVDQRERLITGLCDKCFPSDSDALWNEEQEAAYYESLNLGFENL